MTVIVFCYILVFNKATGEVLGNVPDMNRDDAEDAVKKAYEAFQTWKNTTAKVCSNYTKKGIFSMFI